MKLTKSIRLASVLVLAASVLAIAVACSDDDGDEPENTGATGSAPTATAGAGGSGGSLSGAVEIDGSSTVFPITEAVAEEFRAAQSGVQVTVGISGTGGGFERFCNGETDISDASRPISPTDEDEIPVCEANGIEYVEIPVAYDGLAVVVHPDNDWIECITTEQLATIWSPDSEGQVTSWSDVDPSFPDEDLVLFGPGTDSGTFDYFTGEINGEEGASRTDYTPSEDDNVLVQGVAGSPGGSGYFGLAYLIENEGAIKGLQVDGGDGCVEPTPENVLSGAYPLSRPLFIYVKLESAETKPQVEAFVDFYLENVATLAPDVGYVQFPAEFYAIIGERWSSRTTGSIFSGADGTVGQILGASGSSSSGGGSSSAAALSGAVGIDGSSTVFPITEAVAEEFRGVQGGVQVTVGISGTGGGFERFCNGETDISDASRPISPTDEDEIPVCEANGIEYVEIPVAYDGLAVVVHPDNDWIECITTEQLATIWSPDSEGQVTSWSDVDPSFPDEELVLFGPGTDSGTFDYFTGEINGEEGASRTDYTPSEDDNVLVQGVAGSPGGSGYFGLAYLIENEGAIKGLQVDGGDGCVEPTPENVLSGAYPLSRPLFIYVKLESAETKPQVEAFVDFYLENVATLAPDVGYVQFPAEFYAIIGERWSSRTTGSIFSGADGTVGEILGAQ